MNELQIRQKNRRNLLIGAVGVGAAALGASIAWRRNRPAGPVAGPAAAFWSARFDTMEGGELLAASLRGKPLLLNFWASWCAPCVKELPEIAQFARETKSWNVLGLAVDSRESVQQFLKKIPLDMPVALAGLTGADLARTLGNPQGGLPYTIAFNEAGEKAWEKLGPTSLKELRDLAAKGV